LLSSEVTWSEFRENVGCDHHLKRKGSTIVRHSQGAFGGSRAPAAPGPVNAHAGLTPAATSTSAGATNPVGVSNVFNASATSAHAATRLASGTSLSTAR
jgi:hypothetical protein